MAGRVSTLRSFRDRLLRGGSGSPRRGPLSRGSARLLAVIGFLGPGLIAANAGNDAGGIATYSSVGARYGYDLLWMMVVITVSLIVVQEMAARMGAVTEAQHYRDAINDVYADELTNWAPPYQIPGRRLRFIN